MTAPARSGPEPKQTQGQVYRVLGIAMCCIAVGLFAAANAHGPHDNRYFICGLLLLAIGVPLFIRGKRYINPRAEDVLRDDKRPPIIYLRSFDDEAVEAGLAAAARLAFTREGLAGNISPWGAEEQFQLAKFFNEIGPYVALGRPGESIPEMGAARMYVPNDKWQETVAGLLQRARVVVIRAGRTEGLRWEIAWLVAKNHARKLLFILPGTPKAYEAFCLWVNHELPYKLPRAMPKERLLTFDQNWKPILLAARGGLRDTLAPFLAQNRIVLPVR